MPSASSSSLDAAGTEKEAMELVLSRVKSNSRRAVVREICQQESGLLRGTVAITVDLHDVVKPGENT
jgi:hypothetical protein